MQEQIQQQEILSNAKELLLKAAKDMHYDDNRRFIKRHLEYMAELVQEYEDKGYEVIVETNTSDYGRIRVSLSPRDWPTDPTKPNADVVEITAYEMALDPAEFKNENFKNPYPGKESVRKAFDGTIEKIEKIKANRASQEKENSIRTAA